MHVFVIVSVEGINAGTSMSVRRVMVGVLRTVTILWALTTVNAQRDMNSVTTGIHVRVSKLVSVLQLRELIFC